MVYTCLSDPMINRRMPQYKKHKTWDGDAVLVLNGTKGTMYDLEGKLYAAVFHCLNTWLNVPSRSIGAGSLTAPGVEEGGEYAFGGKEVGVDHSISRADYLSGKCFGRGSNVTSTTTTSTSTIHKQFGPLKSSNHVTPYKTPTRKIVDLQPVNLVSGQPNTTARDSQGSKSYWTANWYAYINLGNHVGNSDLGVDLKPGNTRLGMATHLSSRSETS